MHKVLLLTVSGLVFALIGCKPSLIPDPNPYSIYSNYPTAEVWACGKRMNLGSCALSLGEPLNNLNLKIQGYFEGTARVYSDACGIDSTVRFSRSKLFNVHLPGIVKNSCVISIAITPEFPGELDSGIVIGSLEAFIRVKAIEKGARYLSFVSKIPSKASASVFIKTTGGRLILRGCEANIDRTVPAGETDLNLSEVPNLGVSRCAYEGAIAEENGTIFFNWLVWRYDDKYVPAALPSLEEDGEDLIVQADPATFLIIFDDKQYSGNSASFEFEKTEAHTLRTITVGGRNIIGEYAPNKGWSWIR